MSTLRRSILGVVAGAAVVVAIVLLLGGHHSASSESAPGSMRPPSTRSVSPVQAAIARAQQAFVAGYLAYLDGAGGPGRLPFASITAREQAAQGGRIPAAFRDGALRVVRVSGARTDYSAQATVTAVNRSESYVLSVQLLLTQDGWRVAQLTPPDLAMDDQTRPVLGPTIPAAGRLATRVFAIAYAAYRTATAPIPAGMTATARQELADGQDPLAAARRVGVRPRLLGVRFGPPEGSEVAATATVQSGRGRTQFTVLMVNRSGRWECDAFL
jgi:hypothetical protein